MAAKKEVIETLESLNSKLVTKRIERQHIAASTQLMFSKKGSNVGYGNTISSDPDSLCNRYKARVLNDLDTDILILDTKYRELVEKQNERQ